jgi:hypothetical protein
LRLALVSIICILYWKIESLNFTLLAIEVPPQDPAIPKNAAALLVCSSKFSSDLISRCGIGYGEIAFYGCPS